MERPAWTAQCTNRKLIGELLPVRRRESHKGDYGRVLLLCGSEGLTGAARLAAKAALRTGSGLVYLGVPEKIYPIIAAGAGSEIVFPLPCDEAGRLCMAALPAITARLPEMDAVLLGPGLGRSEELTRLVQAVLSICRVPLGLDADGEVIGYKFVHLGKMMDMIKKGVDANEALEKAKGSYGRFAEAAKYIDPRKE